MRSFIISLIACAGIAVASNMILNGIGFSSADANSSDAVRLGK